MSGTAPAWVAVLTLCAVALVLIVRAWPAADRRTGAETTVEGRACVDRVHGAIVSQAWRACRPCGGVTAVVLHPGAHVCDAGHLTITTTGDRS